MKTTDRPRGFTLIELVIAIMFLSVALIGLAAVTTTTIKGNAFSKSMTTATTLVNDKIQALTVSTFPGAELPAGNPNDAGNPIQGIYTRSWTVVDTAGSGGSVRYKTITVPVAWTWQGLSHSVQLPTIRARD
jgi:type IV pilus assembly protein PilV